MKQIIVLISFLFVFINTKECPFGFDKIFGNTEQNLKQIGKLCKPNEILIGEKCKINQPMINGNREKINSKLDFTYNFPDSNSIDIQLSLKQKSWMAIGFKNEMDIYNIIFASISGNDVNIYEAYLNEDIVKMKDQSASEIKGYETLENQTIVSFNRILKPKNKEGQPSFSHIQKNIGQQLIFFYGKHQGDLQVNLKKSNINSEDLDSYTIISEGFTLSWTVNSEQNEVQFSVDLEMKSWFGIGFGPSMTGTDMIVVQIEGSRVNVQEMYSTGNEAPQPYEDQSGISVNSHSVSDVSITVKFTRKLDTGIDGQIILTENTLYTFIAAHSPPINPSDTMDYHGKYHYQFPLILKNGFDISTDLCPKNEVYIDLKCQKNDLKELSSNQAIDNGFNLSWTVLSNKVQFMVELDMRSWVGIGFGQYMDLSDMIIAQIFNNNVVKIYEGIAILHTPPQYNEDGHVTLLGYEVTEQSIKYKFQRPLVGEGPYFVTLQEGQVYDMIAAHSNPEDPQDYMEYHDNDSYQFQIELANGEIVIECTDGEVLIDGQCVENNLTELSSYKYISSTTKFSWEVNSDQTVDFMFELGIKSYVGLSFGENFLTDNDTTFCQIYENNTVKVSEGILNEDFIPFQNQSLVQLLGYEVTSYHATYKYRRQMIDSQSGSIQLKQGDIYDILVIERSSAEESDQFNPQEYKYTKSQFLLDNQQVPESDCPEGQVLIDGNCKDNDLSELSSNQIIDGEQFTIQWQMVDNNKRVQFLVELKNLQSWIGISISEEDTIYARIENDNQITIQEGTFGFPFVPFSDQSAVELLGYDVGLSSVKFKFSRKMKPNITGATQLNASQYYIFQASHCYYNKPQNKINLLFVNEYDFIVKLVNNFNPDSPLCTDGEVFIDQKCQQNDIEPLSSYTVITDGFNLSWEIPKKQKNTILFIMEIDYRTWTGIGFGEQMIGTDMIIAQIIDNDVVTIYEGVATGHSAPEPNVDQSNHKLLGYSVSENSVIVKFSRDMTTDIEGYAQLVQGQFQNMIAASSTKLHPSDTIDSHASSRYIFEIFLENNITPSTSLCPDGEVLIENSCVVNNISDLDSSSIEISDGFGLQWNIDEDQETIQFLVSLNLRSWFGIGFGEMMDGTDMIIAQIYENQIVKIYEGVAQGHAPPIPNKNQGSIKLLGYALSDDQIIVKFVRQMQPDISSCINLISGEEQQMIAAHSDPEEPSEKIDFHESSHYNFVIVLDNNWVPALCPDGEVLIDGECVENDLESLSSTINIVDGYTFQYSVSSEYLTVLIQLNLRSWVGIGFGEQMKDTDMIIAQIENKNVVTIYEGIATGHKAPQPNEDQSDIKLLGYEITSDSVKIKYQRQMSPDIEGCAQLKEGETYTWITAFSDINNPQDQIGYHEQSNYDFEIKLVDNWDPTDEPCPEGQVLIDGECVDNDLENLSSTIEIIDGYTFQYSVNDKYIIVLAELELRTWVGIGFGEQMKGTDMIIAQIDDKDIVTIYEGVATGHKAPEPNEDQSDIQLLGYEVTQNSIKVKYLRQMKPEIDGYAQLEQGETYTWITAFSDVKNPKDQIGFHKSSHYDFQIKLVDNWDPEDQPCPEGQVLIDGECVDNDLEKLTSNITVTDGYVLQYSVSEEYLIIMAELELRTWVGIGFGEQMEGTDMIIAQVEDKDVVTIYEGVATGHSAPEPNEDQSDLQLLGYEVTLHSIKVKYQRQMQPQIDGYAQLQVGQTYTWITAFSDGEDPQDQIGYHGNSHYDFEIKLVNDWDPTDEPCPEGQVLIDGECVENDLTNLSSTIDIIDGYTLQYSVDGEYIQFLAELELRTWVGIGFGEQMEGTDMIIAQIEDKNVVTIYEGVATGHSAPEPNEDQSDLQLLGYEVTLHSIKVKYQRQMQPQIDGYAQLQVGQTYTWITAFSDGEDPQDQIGYHGNSHYDFEVKLVNNWTPDDQPCPEGQVLIDGECVDNDLEKLSSNLEIIDGYTFQYQVNDKYMTVLVELELRTWVGIGFGEQMKGTDMVIVQIEDQNIISIYEGVATGHKAPEPNEDQSDIQLLGYEVTQNSIKVKFQREMQPQIEDYAQLQDGETYNWITAFSDVENPQDQIAYHKSSHYNFEIKLVNNWTPDDQPCPEGQVLIDGECVENDLKDLSSSITINDGYTLQYSVSQQLFTFMIELQLRSWVGLGFGEQMKGTDMVITQIDEKNIVTVYEGIATGHKAPKPNEDQSDVQLLGYEITQNSIKVKIQRQMQPDIEGYAQLQDGETYTWITAFSDVNDPQGQIGYHKSSHYDFEIKLENNWNPDEKPCPEGQVLIDGECVDNDLEGLSSQIEILDGYTLQYQVSDKYITFMAELNLRTWVGIGFGEQMKGTDMIIAQIEDKDTVTIYEGVATGHKAPEPNEDQSDLQLLGYEVTQNSIKVKFQREMQPQIEGYTQLEDGETYNWITAFSDVESPQDYIGYHKSSHYDFEIKLVNNWKPDDQPCPEGQVLIDGECIDNDLENLSSKITVIDGYELQYSISEQYLTMMIELELRTWVGLGFGEVMKGTDMIIAQIDDQNVVTIYEGVATGHKAPEPNEDQSDIQLLGYEVTQNSIKVKFQREMQPQIEDYVQLQEGETYTWITAFSDVENPQDQIGYHKSSHYDFEIKLINDYEPVDPICPEGQVFIDGECVDNDLGDLCSRIQIIDGYILQYCVSEEYITMLVELDMRSWVGIGFGNRMIGTDMIISEILEDNIVTTYEGMATDYASPEPNEDQSDIQLLGYAVTDDSIKIKFKREMQPDIEGCAQLELGATYTWITAFSAPNDPQDQIGYHGTDHYMFQIQLVNDYDPEDQDCPEGQVVIDGECKTNDLENLESYINIVDGYQLQYSVSEQYLTVMITLDMRSWVGIGFGSVMIETDMIVAQIGKNGIVYLYEGIAVGQYAPPPDPDQSDYQLLGYQVTQRSMQVKFRREMTPDIPGYAQLQEGKTYNWITAFSQVDKPSDKIGYHGDSHHNFDIKLINGFTPLNLVCPDGEVIIEGVCQDNDLADLSSHGIIQKSFFEIEWEISNDQKYVTFMLTLEQISWAGIGFGHFMKGTDMIVANIRKNKLGLENYYFNRRYLKNKDSTQDYIVTVYEGQATGQSQPPPFSNQDFLQLLGYQVENNEFKVKFRRQMQPEQNQDGPQPTKLTADKIQNMVSAYSEDKSLQVDYHGNNKFQYQIKIENDQDSIIEGAPATFMQVHEWFFFIGWGILIDFAIVFARNFRIWKVYLMLHGFIILIVDLGTVVIFSMTLYYFRKSLNQVPSGFYGCHYINALIFFGFFILQHIGGIFLKYKFIDPQQGNQDRLAKYRKLHQLFGHFVYLQAKLQVISGLYWANKMTYCYILIASVLVFRITMEILHQKKPDWYLSFFFSSKKRLSGKQIPLQHRRLLAFIRSGASRREIAECLPDVKYVIACNQVCIVNDFVHPGGNYLLNLVNGRDIDCFLFGGYAHEESSRKPYSHSKLAYTWIMTHSIGTLHNSNQNFIRENDSLLNQVTIFRDQSIELNDNPKLQMKHSIYSDLSSNHGSAKGSERGSQQGSIKGNSVIGLNDASSIFGTQITQKLIEQAEIESIGDDDKEGDNRTFQFEAEMKDIKHLSKDVARFDFRITQDQELQRVNNYMYGVEWMGKHFTLRLKTQSQKKRNYTTVISQQQENVILRSKQIELWKQNFNYKLNYEEYDNMGKTMPLIIKDYTIPTALSHKIHNEHRHSLYKLEGPHGLGLQINQYSQGQYVIVSGGTGILPFLDFLDFILKKYLYIEAQKKKGIEYARENFDPYNTGLNNYLNNFQLNVYASFTTVDDFLGRDILEPLTLLTRKAGYKNIEICLRFSDHSQIHNMRCVEQRFDDEFMHREFINMKRVQRAWVCGPPQLQKTLPTILGHYMDKQNIEII